MTNEKKPGTGVTNKRRRQLAAAKAERQAARRAAREAQHRRRVRIGSALAALVAVLGIAAVVFWPEGSGDTVASPSASPSASPTPSDIGCEPAPTPPAEPATYEKAPEPALAPDTKYTLTLDTNCGPITIATLPKKAPETVNSMLWLAQEGYFDNTLCHRLTTENLYVLQCGDPTATGSGGPGYTVPDENLPKDAEANYPAGTVAMANSGADTSGSQFFIVYKDTTLPPDYTIWGTVTDGMDVVARVAEAGVLGGGGNGKPAAQIGILTATVDPELG